MQTTEPVYVILLTSRDAKSDIVTGLQSGANDYVTKPFDRAELQARVRVGQNVVERPGRCRSAPGNQLTVSLSVLPGLMLL